MICRGNMCMTIPVLFAKQAGRSPEGARRAPKGRSQAQLRYLPIVSYESLYATTIFFQFLSDVTPCIVNSAYFGNTSQFSHLLPLSFMGSCYFNRNKIRTGQVFYRRYPLRLKLGVNDISLDSSQYSDSIYY